MSESTECKVALFNDELKVILAIGFVEDEFLLASDTKPVHQRESGIYEDQVVCSVLLTVREIIPEYTNDSHD